MAGDGLDALSRADRDALRDLLVRATAASGRDADARTIDDLRGLGAAAPIAHLPAAAELHRVGGTVLRGLASVDGVPPEVREALARQRRRAAMHHLLVVGALSEIARAFDDAGLVWVVMKGPALAARLYPDVGDRAYADLDLLVSRGDYAPAIAILERLGYLHSIHNWALAERMLAGQIGLSRGRVSIDLHWHLHYSGEDRRPFALRPGGMLERRRRVDVSGLTVPVFDPVDGVLTLAFHAARSDGHRLVWLKDIERSLAVEPPDLDALSARCREERCGPPVGLMLHRARTTLGADVPAELTDALAPGLLRASDRVVRRVVDPVQFHERPTLTRLFTRSMRATLVASVADVPARAARLLARRLRPPAENETDDPDEKAAYLRAVLHAREP